jgi:hypothetical protein
VVDKRYSFEFGFELGVGFGMGRNLWLVVARIPWGGAVDKNWIGLKRWAMGKSWYEWAVVGMVGMGWIEMGKNWC